MLDGAKRILELYDDDEFKPIIIEGDHGYGKSTYANRLISEVYSLKELGWGGNGKRANWNIKLFKSHMGFHPNEVVKKWKAKRSRDHCFHWDDAGLWLHNLDFQNKFVKSAGKYMQVVRNDWACVMYTAISKEDITSKIRGLRNTIIVEITKDGCSRTHPDRRTASAYIIRKGWHGREYKDYQWVETFNSHVPGTYTVSRKGQVLKKVGFYGWYKPVRDRYSQMAKELMAKSAKEESDFDIKFKGMM